MILPTRLSEAALAILRLFLAEEARKAGSCIPIDTIRSRWKGPDAEIASGLAELAREGLVTSVSDPVPQEAVLTQEGEAFFARFYRACHG